jgi:hypothetical protein
MPRPKKPRTLKDDGALIKAPDGSITALTTISRMMRNTPDEIARRRKLCRQFRTGLSEVGVSLIYFCQLTGAAPSTAYRWVADHEDCVPPPVWAVKFKDHLKSTPGFLALLRKECPRKPGPRHKRKKDT